MYIKIPGRAYLYLYTEIERLLKTRYTLWVVFFMSIQNRNYPDVISRSYYVGYNE